MARGDRHRDQPETPATLLDATVARLGMPSILVHNTASWAGGGYQELDASTLDAHYAVNVRGAPLLSVAFACR